MKLITRQELMQLPKGSIVAEGDRYFMDDMFVFVEPLFNDDGKAIDFVYTNVSNAFDTDYLNNLDFNGTQLPADLLSTGRDGCYNDDASYWLWEESDLLQLKTVVETALQILRQGDSNGTA